MIYGSCHCQAVKFESAHMPEKAEFCHCRTCRKINGSAHGASASVLSEGFRVIYGKDFVVEYESSPGKTRCFCLVCGTHVYAFTDSQPDYIILRLGCLEGGHGIVPEEHIWVSHKEPWYKIPEGLILHDEW